ncbi:1890_t:CDS:2, partial [Entrophospora sp. SA101]
VEDIEVVTGDYVVQSYLSDFQAAWEQLGEDGQVVETFALTAIKSLKDSGTPQSNNVHTLLLSGVFLGGSKVLAKCIMTFAQSTGVTMELSIRSENENISRYVIGAV